MGDIKATTESNLSLSGIGVEELSAMIRSIVSSEIALSKGPQSEGLLDDGTSVISDARSLKQEYERLNIYNGVPTNADLLSINNLTGRTWAADDWSVWSFKASDNLLHGDESVWHDALLAKIGKNYKGAVFMVDHAWEDSDAAMGYVIDSQLIEQPIPSAKTINASIFGSSNRKLLKSKPYQFALMKVAVRAGSPFDVAAVERRAQFCSTGFHLYNRKLICPNCTAERGKETEFSAMEKIKENGATRYKRICSHTAPSPFLRALIKRWGEAGYEMNWADYSIQHGDLHPVELSAVSSPMLPDCQILRDAPYRESV